jgi:phospholipid/cholesterol/gamma-HCH transport system substrate-binding protein
MEAKREQAFVGLFIIVAGTLLIIALFWISGIFGRSGNHYHAYFKNAGGLAAGSEVRYAGSPPVGRVVDVKPDANDPTRMEVDFRVKPEIPVKTDSVAKITTLSALGDYFLEIEPGSPSAPPAPSESVLRSKDFTGLDQIEAEIGDLAPQAQELIKNLNARVVELKETLNRVNDLINAENRANISKSLANVNGMLAEDRPLVHSTLKNVNDVSAKAGPLMDDLKKTMAQANDAISHIDATLLENRPDLRQIIQKMKETLNSAASATDQLDRTLNVNSDNIDEILENARHITENLKEFTDTIKKRPYTLVRATEPKEHQPGEATKP